MYPYNFKRGQTIQTDATGVSDDRAFGAHHNVPAASASAESDAGVLAATDLNATAQSITTGITNPAVPRNVKVKGNASGVNNVVKVYGTNYDGDAISEEITPNGETAVPGALAFKTITKIDLPVEDHTAAKQKTTSAVSAATGAGTAVLTVAAAILGEDGVDVTVVLAAGDVASTTTAATAIKNALNANAAFAAHFVATSSTNNVIMEALVAAPQDATVDLTVKSAGDTGLVIGSITVNTTAGVRDRISVGLGKKFGIPYKLAADELVIVKLFNNTADTGTVTADATDIEKNVIELNGTADGLKPIDLYILV
jgi:hypothetical protein